MESPKIVTTIRDYQLGTIEIIKDGKSLGVFEVNKLNYFSEQADYNVAIEELLSRVLNQVAEKCASDIKGSMIPGTSIPYIVREAMIKHFRIPAGKEFPTGIHKWLTA